MPHRRYEQDKACILLSAVLLNQVLWLQAYESSAGSSAEQSKEAFRAQVVSTAVGHMCFAKGLGSSDLW